MKSRFSRRDFLKMSMLGLGSAYLAACGKVLTPAPPANTMMPSGTPLPTGTQLPLPIDTIVPPPTNTSTPAPVDIPAFKTSFEGITDLAANGISSAQNEVRINTQNVDYQGGKQSLEANGTIAGALYSTLTIDLSVKKLTGKDTVDLSNKKVGFYYFIPADLPIKDINLVAVAGAKSVQLTSFYNDDPGKWHYAQADVKSIFETNKWGYTNLANADARQVVSHCQVIQLAGIRTDAGAANPTSFLVDDLNWIGINDINHLALDDSIDTIRKYANLKRQRVGTVMLLEWFQDQWYPYTLAQEFNLTMVGAMNPPETKPANISAMNFDYTELDKMQAFAQGNHMQIRGATGGWHLLLPRWVLDASYDELKAFLERKIELDIGHYGGKVYSWGIFNEPISDEGNGFRNRRRKNPNDPNASASVPYGYNYSPFVDGTNTSLIDAAFIKARQMDPNAALYINEFDIEEMGKQKSEFFYKWIAGMKDRGIPIDGAGFECHKMFPQLPGAPQTSIEDLDGYLDRVDRNMKRYAAAGFKVEITEFECQIRFDDINFAAQSGRNELDRRAQKQAEMYAGFMKLAIDNPNVLSFTIWSLADKPHTSGWDSPWIPFTITDSFPFDKNYNRKPAYDAILKVLQEA